MTKIQDLRQLAHTIKNETKVGGNTADRVGSAFEGVADALEGTEQIAEMDKAVQEVQQHVETSKAQIQTLVNSLPVVQQTGDSTTSVMSQKAVCNSIASLSDFFFLCTSNTDSLVLSFENGVYSLKISGIYYACVYSDGQLKALRIDKKTYTCFTLAQPSLWLLLLYNYVEKVFYVTEWNNAIQENVIALAQFNLSIPTKCTYLARGLSAITFNNKVYEKTWNIPEVVQSVGAAEDKVMSQKAVCNSIAPLSDFFFLELTGSSGLVLSFEDEAYKLYVKGLYYNVYADGKMVTNKIENNTYTCSVLAQPKEWILLLYNYIENAFYVTNWNNAIKENVIALAQFNLSIPTKCTYLARGLSAITFNNKVYEKTWSIPEVQRTTANNVFEVGKGLKYETITAAYEEAINVSSKDNPCTILINPGVYKEVIRARGDKYVSFVGTNKHDVIWKYGTANYEYAPLRIAGSCYVANITFISTADDYVSDVDGTKGWAAFKRDSLNGHIHEGYPQWVGRMGAYAVHCDDDHTDKSSLEVSIFENCIMYSKTSPAFGAGIWPSTKIVLKDCDLISDYDEELYNKFTTELKGALYAHGLQANISHGQFGECYVIKNCKIESNFSPAIVTEKVASNIDDLKYMFYYNIAISNSNKTGSIVANFGTKMDISSFGNNVEDLNYKL